MNKVLLIGAVLVLSMVVPCLSNPLPPYEIESIHAYPPQIGLTCYIPSMDISGRLIIIDSDTAVVNQGIIIYQNWPSGDPIILDSSNTSGFTLNPTGSCVSVYLTPGVWGDDISFGQKGCSSAIIEGHFIRKTSTDIEGWDLFTFDFAQMRPGRTNVLINEVNAAGNWNRCCNFIELYNKASYPISLASWKLISDTIYCFPVDAVIPGHGFYVVDECDLPAKFHISGDGDNLYLLNSDTLVDQVGWSSNHGANVSFMRFPDGDADTIRRTGFLGYNDSSSSSFENGFPSRDASNRHENTGFIVIGARADSVNVNAARLNWTNPIWDLNFELAIVVRSDIGFVSDPAEGTIIYEGFEQSYLDNDLSLNQRYYYTIFARKYDNSYSFPTSESQTSIILHSAGITENSNLPADFHISCYPNPFNAQTIIAFTLPKSEEARIAIFDISGKLVDVLAKHVFKAGQNSVVWDASDRPSGVYFYSVMSASGNQTKTVVLMK